MRAAAHALTQPALFEMSPAAYTEADRVADRKLCWDYTKQWAGSFKRSNASTAVNFEDFEAAAHRLAQ